MVIEALTEILKEAAARALRLKQPIAIPVTPMLVRKLLCFVSDTRADKPVPIENGEITEKKYGWRYDHTPPPFVTTPIPTADTVLSLALINRMLDEQINARVLYHFSVKHPEDLEKGPDLDTFFYSDYGLRAVDPHGDHGSIAFLLQQMRAHVVGLCDSETLCSLVLYGPPGTGKTTSAEALASSCRVPLVEVTPSDILVGGEEAVERSAGLVFETLSLLTRVVILFDEFDPVLWKREPSGDRPSTIFGFLTASMLPKLKRLHKAAERRSVAYVLITNLIHVLDEPTVRKGRFDKKLGIYPPDVLSRAGRFLSEAIALLRDPGTYLPNDPVSKDHLKTIIGKISSGAGMEELNRKGYFRRPDNKAVLKGGIPLKQLLEDKTPLRYYLLGGSEPRKIVPDAQLKAPKGEGEDEIREWQEWKWIETWDEYFIAEKDLQGLAKRPDNLPSLPRCWRVVMRARRFWRRWHD